MDLRLYLVALALIPGVSVAARLVSVVIRNVAFIDSLWSFFPGSPKNASAALEVQLP